MSVLNPAQGSPGHGRYHANGRVVARVVLADKRTALLSVATSGVVTPLLYTNQAAPTDDAPEAGGASYRTFFDPLVNAEGDVAFVAGLKSKGMHGSNKTGLWWGRRPTS